MAPSHTGSQRFFELEISFLSSEQGGRQRALDLSKPTYRPHLRVPPSTETLGVEFIPTSHGGVLRGETITVTVRALFSSSGVAYGLLQPGAAVEVVEGPRLVARGSVVRAWQTKSGG